MKLMVTNISVNLYYKTSSCVRQSSNYGNTFYCNKLDFESMLRILKGIFEIILDMGEFKVGQSVLFYCVILVHFHNMWLEYLNKVCCSCLQAKGVEIFLIFMCI